MVPKKFLMVLDPPETLDIASDTSLNLLFELSRRGHETWITDVGGILDRDGALEAVATCIRPTSPAELQTGKPEKRKALDFDLVLIRKEPPVDASYYYLTYALERIATQRPVINHPAGIRNNNEKLAIFNFPDRIPATLVASHAKDILRYSQELGKPLVIKPLDQKGGKGIFIFKGDAAGARQLEALTGGGRTPVMAQEFLGLGRDKRILILDGKVLTAYEKQPAPGEFRANLSLGASYHPTELTLGEQELVSQMAPYLIKEGLSFVGIDVMKEKLLEVNVTCPAGLYEASKLYPQGRFAQSWADSLERRL